MSDILRSIDAIEASSGSTTAVHISELAQQRYDEQNQRADFDDLAQRVIEVAIERPGGSGHISDKRLELLGGRDGAVGEAKSELVSDVSRAGTEHSGEVNHDVEASLEDRVMTLYSDLTDYQVAWRIAQKIPQDLSQILKGN